MAAKGYYTKIRTKVNNWTQNRQRTNLYFALASAYSQNTWNKLQIQIVCELRFMNSPMHLRAWISGQGQFGWWKKTFDKKFHAQAWDFRQRFLCINQAYLGHRIRISSYFNFIQKFAKIFEFSIIMRCPSIRLVTMRILLLRVSSAKAYCYYAYAQYKRSKSQKLLKIYAYAEPTHSNNMLRLS
jgi:hypothetical protein